MIFHLISAYPAIFKVQTLNYSTSHEYEKFTTILDLQSSCSLPIKHKVGYSHNQSNFITFVVVIKKICGYKANPLFPMGHFCQNQK